MISLIVLSCIIIVFIVSCIGDHFYRKRHYSNPENAFDDVSQWCVILFVLCLLIISIFLNINHADRNWTKLDSEYCNDWYVIYHDETNNKFYRPIFVMSKSFAHYEFRELNQQEMKSLSTTIIEKQNANDDLYQLVNAINNN